MIRFVLCLLVVTLGAQSAGPVKTDLTYGSQCPSTATSGAAVLADARAIRQKGNAEAALHCFARAAADGAARGDVRLEADARAAFAQAAYGASRLELAAAQAIAAQALFVELQDRLNEARMTRLSASIALLRNDLPEAARLYTAALDIFTALGEPRDRIATLTDLARSLPEPGRTPRLDEALALARETGARDLEGVALHLRSDHHFGAGRFDAAVADLLKAIERLEGTAAVTRLSDACVSMGRILRAHGRYDEAIRYYDRAIGIQENSGDRRGLIQSLNARAIALGHLNRHTESRTAYERALAIATETGNTRLIDFQQGNLASAYTAEGDYARAIRTLEDVLQREKDPYILAYRYGNLASLRQTTKESAAAVPLIERAIGFARETTNNDYLPILLQTASLIYGDVGRTADALASASEGIEVLERIRSRLAPLDFMKRGFGERWQDLYGATIRVLQQQGRPDQALLTGEMARARAFLDLLASRELPDRGLAAVAGSIDLRQGGVTSQAAARTVSGAGIAATAARLSSVIVSYWVTNDEVFIWVSAPKAPTRSVRMPIARKELEALIATAVPRPGQRPTPALARLHTLLIAPVRKWLPAGTPLTIIPHGPLFRVSFAALRDPVGIYLIERHPVSYAPSVSTLDFTARRLARTKMGSGRTYLLIADPSPLPVETPPLGGLPAARRETTEIARLLAPRPSLMLTGARADETGVRTSLLRARVVHFATHGVIRDDQPFESFLALGAGGRAPASDGRLTVRELYDVELNAELVVLSACSTATGPPSGDGISGLSRALFYAGATSVLATLWDVADEPSAMLMAGFYKHWQGGMNKRSALRRAQIDLLRALRAGTVTVKAGPGTVPLEEQPYYWAAYILVGES